MGNFVSRDAISQAMQEIDQNGDGEIDFEEFMQMMKPFLFLTLVVSSLKQCSHNHD